MQWNPVAIRRHDDLLKSAPIRGGISMLAVAVAAWTSLCGAAGAVEIVTTSLPSGMEMVSYDQQLEATGQ